MAGIFGSPLGGLIGNVMGGVISGAVNAAQNAASKIPNTGSSGSSKPSTSSGSAGSSKPATSSGSSGSAKPATSSGSSGGNVLQSVNGKAPSNAQVGDTIITNGGSYLITGKNPDGSWISQKVSDVHTNRYPTTSGTSNQGTASSSNNSISGGRVLLSVNGQAPSSAQIGDTILTNGGSYLITGKNPDGSWVSEKVSDVSTNRYPNSGSTKPPENFTGSANNIQISGELQQQIIAQMNANSKAWYEAKTQAERDALHAKNEELAAILGGNVKYDGHTGMWYGTAGSEDVELVEEPEDPDAGEKKPGDNSVSTINPDDFTSILDKWLEAAKQQSQNASDFAVSQGINELKRAEDDARAQFQTQRDQIASQEALNKDNQALYSEVRGDRGGIGEAQYDSIMNTAMQQQAAVNQAQTQLSTETARQIADLRAQGEFQKADDLLELTQTYLSQLISLQEWAAAYNLDVAQFNAQLEQWQKEFELSVGQLLGNYKGQPTLESQQIAYAQQQDLKQQLASAGSTLLEAGIMPSDSQLSAMGMTKEQAQSYIKAWQISNTAKGSSGGSGGSGGGSSGGGTTTPQVTTPGDPMTIYKTLYRLGYRTKEDAYAYLIDQDYSSTEADNLSSMFEDKVENGDFEVGGMSSDYFRAFAQSLTSRLGSGRVEQALNDVNRWWGSMSFAQQVETEKILSRYGYSIQ